MTSKKGNVLVATADLMALARVQESAARHGRDVKTTSLEALAETVRTTPAEFLVLDLDWGGLPLVEAASRLDRVDAPSLRVLAFFSHVDESLGAAAKQEGFESFARGKFWRSLDDLLA